MDAAALPASIQGESHEPGDPDPAGAATALTALATAPAALSLGFAPDRHDYVARCPTDQPTTLSGAVATGHRARLFPLGPAAGPPSTVTGAFTLAVSPPGVTSVRIEISAIGAPTVLVATYRVRCLPATFPTFTTSVTGVPQSAYYIVTHGSWDIVVDAEGTPVWWLRAAQGAPVDAKLIGGELVTTVPGAPYQFRDWDATPTRVVAHGLDHHDLQRTADGDLVGFQYYDSDRGLLEEARFVRLDPSGNEVWSWRTQDHIDAAEMAPDTYKLTWGHANSVEPHGEDGVLVSIRNLDAIYDLDMATDAISWKLGGTPTPESLAVYDGGRLLADAEVLRLFSGQHDARILPDGTVSVLDNGTRALSRRPRVLRFAIDLAQRRATLLETVTDPRAGYSFGLASARRTAGGNWVVSWGGWNDYITELDPTGRPVFTMSGVSTYRAVPVEHGELDDEGMRSGMDAMAGSPPGITGSVTALGSGAPVPSAAVAVLRADDLTLAAATVADADGDFATPLDPGAYFVYVLDVLGRHRSGFVGDPTPVTFTVTGRTPRDVIVPLAPQRGSVVGRVTDASSGLGIPGAWAVSLHRATGAPELATVADATGAYTLSDLSPGPRLAVFVDPSGARATRFFGDTPDPTAASPILVAAGAVSPASAALPAQPWSAGSVTLQGTVTEAGTNRPLPRVLVLAVHAAQFTLTRAGVTDGTGRYDLVVPPGSYKLAFLDPTGGHSMEWHADRPYQGLGEAVSVTAPATANASLERTTGAMAGTVTDATTHAPLAGMWVIAIGPSGPAGGAATSADGSYSIHGLPPGTYRAAFVDPTAAHRVVYWDDSADYPGANPFAVSAGSTVTIDAGMTGG